MHSALRFLLMASGAMAAFADSREPPASSKSRRLGLARRGLALLGHRHPQLGGVRAQGLGLRGLGFRVVRFRVWGGGGAFKTAAPNFAWDGRIPSPFPWFEYFRMLFLLHLEVDVAQRCLWNTLRESPRMQYRMNLCIHTNINTYRQTGRTNRQEDILHNLPAPASIYMQTFT